MRRPPFVACVAVLAVLAGGCGATSGSGDIDDARLILDGTPNAVHVGIYTALARDFDGAEGVRMRVRAPSEGSDAARLVASGRAEFAVLSINELALARERGRDVVGVMAVLQRPLAAVLAQPRLRSPQGLEGERVGIGGRPAGEAVLRSIVRGAGGDPDAVRTVDAGDDAVRALLSRRVGAVTGFANVEGAAARRERPRIRIFRVDEFGAPAYPELVLATAATTLQDEPDLVAGMVAALRRGYGEALKDPELAVETLVRRNPELERELVLTGLRTVQPAFTTGAERFGELDRARLQAWARWAKRVGIVAQRPDVDLAFRPRVANAVAESEEE